MLPKENDSHFLFVLFFYLHSIILGSRFPQHGVSVGGGWMWTWRAGWRGVGAEGVERSELVGETMREFVRMGAEAVREGGEGPEVPRVEDAVAEKFGHCVWGGERGGEEEGAKDCPGRGRLLFAPLIPP